MLRAVVALLLFAPLAVAAPVPKAMKGKAPDLNGRWEATALWSGRQDVTAMNPVVWVIDGEKLTIHRRQDDGTAQLWEPHTATTLVRPTGGGADEIDYHRDNGKNPYTLKGRVRMDGDEMIACFAEAEDAPRPAELKVSRTTLYYRFKRVTEK